MSNPETTILCRKCGAEGTHHCSMPGCPLPDIKAQSQTTEEQRRVACYLFLSPYHPETWPMDMIDRLVAVRQRDEQEFLIAVRSMTYGH